MAHTLGPWAYGRDGKNTGTLRTATSGKLAEVRWRGFVETRSADEEKDGNGHLIAAAPDLLAALEAALPTLQGTQDSSAEHKARYEFASAAIAKAKAE